MNAKLIFLAFAAVICQANGQYSIFRPQNSIFRPQSSIFGLPNVGLPNFFQQFFGRPFQNLFPFQQQQQQQQFVIPTPVGQFIWQNPSLPSRPPFIPSIPSYPFSSDEVSSEDYPVSSEEYPITSVEYQQPIFRPDEVLISPENPEQIVELYPDVQEDLNVNDNIFEEDFNVNDNIAEEDLSDIPEEQPEEEDISDLPEEESEALVSVEAGAQSEAQSGTQAEAQAEVEAEEVPVALNAEADVQAAPVEAIVDGTLLNIPA